MEIRASYIAVAAYVLILLAGAIGFAFWSSKAPDQSQLVSHYVRLTGSVAGLGVGSAVLFGGIPIGSVTGIYVDPQDGAITRVDLAVRADAPIRVDSHAILESKSLIGGVVVEISRGGKDSPLLRQAEITPGRSTWERLLTGAPKLATKAGALYDQVLLFLTPENSAAFVRILAKFDRLSTAIDGLSAHFHQVMAHGEAASTQVGEAWDGISQDLAAFRKNGGRLLDDGGKAVDELERAGARLGKSKQALDAMLKENQQAFDDFHSTGYPQLPAMMAELRLVLRRYTRLWAEIREDPERFFLGDRDQGYQAK
jgi:phospholipid/cholesterol/gamma-HCH transport system substrate-binding protein